MIPWIMHVPVVTASTPSHTHDIYVKANFRDLSLTYFSDMVLCLGVGTISLHDDSVLDNATGITYIMELLRRSSGDNKTGTLAR